MRKFVVFFGITLACVLFFSCATTGAEPELEPKTETAAVSQSVSTQSPAAQETIPDINARYRDALILDGAENYRVVYRDTLSRLANHRYDRSNGFYFPLIMLASGDTVTNPEKIIPGMQLRIPDLKRNLADPGASRKIQAYLGEIADWYERQGNSRTARGLRELSVLR
ncbi:MAG: hypothetical protein LBS64_04065 [Spirochaetaceae bacterium]|jgi:hypothetical protein|nr:hypothetical protein [Spirochaetaceae bacterium]